MLSFRTHILEWLSAFFRKWQNPSQTTEVIGLDVAGCFTTIFLLIKTFIQATEAIGQLKIFLIKMLKVASHNFLIYSILGHISYWNGQGCVVHLLPIKGVNYNLCEISIKNMLNEFLQISAEYWTSSYYYICLLVCHNKVKDVQSLEDSIYYVSSMVFSKLRIFLVQFLIVMFVINLLPIKKELFKRWEGFLSLEFRYVEGKDLARSCFPSAYIL